MHEQERETFEVSVIGLEEDDTDIDFYNELVKKYKGHSSTEIANIYYSLLADHDVEHPDGERLLVMNVEVVNNNALNYTFSSVLMDDGVFDVTEYRENIGKNKYVFFHPTFKDKLN